MLTIYDWVLGIAEISSVILSILAGIIALTMFRAAAQKRYLKSWKYMITALLFFIIFEAVAALKVFGIFSTTWLTHVLASIIMMCLIAGLAAQINTAKGCD